MSECDCYIETDCAVHNTQFNKLGPCQWNLAGLENQFSPSSGTFQKLPGGYYQYQMTRTGLVFVKVKAKTDDLILLTSGPTLAMSNEINSFWQKSEKFEHHKLLHKRGYILHGKPGCGKTSVLHQIVDITTKNGGIAIEVQDMNNLYSALHMIRTIEPERPILCVYEDIDNYAGDHWWESQLLSILDGEHQINHVIHLATTNYLDRLSPRLRNRPRRFDRIIEIESPSREMREAYLINKLNLTGGKHDLKKWVEDTEHFTFAGLTDLVASVCCLGNPYDEMIQIISEIEHTEENAVPSKQVLVTIPSSTLR